MGPSLNEDLSTDSENTPLSLTETIVVGANIEYLSQAARNPENYEIGDSGGSGIIGRLADIETKLRGSNLETPVTSQVATLRTEFERKYEESDQSLKNQDQEHLQEQAVAWFNLLKEALRDEKRIPAPQTGLLDTTKLLEEPDDLFSSSVWAWLDDTAKRDIEEACRSVAVDCSTACVMLSLRAVEHSLRRWYEAEYEEEIETTAWGGVLDELMEEYVEEEKKNDTVLTQLSDLPPVLSNLYYLKEKRNEVGHPDHSPSDQEARRTLMIVASTITEIYQELEESRLQKLSIPDYSDRDLDDLEDLVYEIIVAIANETDKSGAPRELIHEHAKDAGLSRNEVENAIRDVMMTGRAYEAKGGERIIPI